MSGAACLAMCASFEACAAPLAMLAPDGTSLTDSRVASWLDAGREEGLLLDVITDTQLMTTGGADYLGIILPDQVHTGAGQSLINTIATYVSQGGKVMLVYDFGALDEAGFYPATGPSRLSMLAGVDYLLYAELLDRTTGLGPIVGAESQLRRIHVPPGKSMPYTAAATTVAPNSTLSLAAVSPSLTSNTVTAAGNTVGKTALASTATFLPVSPSDPGGLRGYDHARQFQYKFSKRQRPGMQRGVMAPKAHASGKFSSGTADFRTASNGNVSSLTTLSVSTASATTLTAATTFASTTTALTAADTAPLQTISGYVYGYLTYPSYVTRGTYAGETIATSPDFGLVAGITPYGNGKVLFVNTPLTYLKSATDGMLMHGFLSLFASDLVGLPRLSKQPNAIGGLTLNWHLDSQEALVPMQKLQQAGIWSKNGPFSIDMTTGPDTVNFGDGLGFDLPNNAAAQQFLRDFVSQGHEVGSHGGYIHDYYGLNATETNQFELTADGIHTFQDLLILNKNATEAVTGRPNREYSSPEGNNPVWALKWSESLGEVGYYFTGDTGLTPTRDYRNGVLVNPGMWAFPVTPFGLYATFEEFQDFQVPKTDVINWYKQLIDFNVATRSDRLIYMHPPGAADWLDVLNTVMTYAKRKGSGAFRWYTMPELANFMAARNQVSWSETGTGPGPRVFVATQPSNLNKMSWLLPKSLYDQPVVNAGRATVADGGDAWIVRAGPGKSLRFTSNHR